MGRPRSAPSTLPFSAHFWGGKCTGRQTLISYYLTEPEDNHLGGIIHLSKNEETEAEEH